MGTTDNFDVPASALNLAATDQIPIKSASTGRGAYLTGTQLKDGVRTLTGTDKMIAGGSTLTLTAALHSGRIIKLDTAAGTTATLPAATGTGDIYRFLVTVIATSNSHVIKVANATDFFVGAIWGVSDDPATVKGWIAANSGTVATNSDTVTLNRTTTGSVTVGEWIEVEDVATATFAIRGLITQTGTEATPFTAGV